MLQAKIEELRKSLAFARESGKAWYNSYCVVLEQRQAVTKELEDTKKALALARESAKTWCAKYYALLTGEDEADYD